MQTDGINPLLGFLTGGTTPTQEAETPKVVEHPESQPAELTRRKEPAQKAAADEGEKKEADQRFVEEQVKELTRVLNESARLFNISLRFRIEKDINRIVVTVFDKTTNEEIRQIPPQEIVQLAKRLEQMEGVLFNATA